MGRVGLPLLSGFPDVPGLGYSWLWSPGERLADRWMATFDAHLQERRHRLLAEAGFAAVARLELEEETISRILIAPGPREEEQEIPFADVLGETAEIGMRVRGRAEVGGDWTRFRPCDPAVQFTCDPSPFPQLTPDLQFGIEVGGTIADRIHVDVDYDQTREFSATNDINVHYQGLPGEVVQRLEVGDVTFALPPSRFLTRGVPAGNFGLRGTARFGSLDVQTVWAQQNGDLSSRELQITGIGDTQGFVQEDTLVMDDADYVRGQFFFLVDPREIQGYPHIDALSLTNLGTTPEVAPGVEAIQVFRFENDPVVRQQVEGYIQAEALAGLEGDTVTESGWFRFLQSGTDYSVHSSGLWLALRRPLRTDEMLAVAYISVSGDTVGSYDPERLHNAGVTPRLRLVKASSRNHQPGRPTWDLELHQVYRVSGSNDVEIPSLELTVSLGELSAGRTFARGPDGADIPYIRLLGLDEEAPVDRIDRSFLYQPAEEAGEGQPSVSGTFLVFPTLRPFAEPPPVRSLGLSSDETAAILGPDANRQIYENEDPFVRQDGGLFRLTVPFRIRTEGLVSSFSLGALGIRNGSERIYLGDRLLRSGVDYVIDYDIGQVTLLDAPGLLASSQDPRLRATWEQKAIFDVAPTSVVGLSAHYDLGDRGGLNLLGMYQAERALVNRPQLGIEPSAVLLGGVNGQLEFGAGWMDRLLDRIPGLRRAGETSLSVGGEVAMSLPNPNRRDAVFVDDFDSGNQQPLSTVSSGWVLGSAPVFRDGAEQELPPVLNEVYAADLAWQHTWVTTAAGGDSTGIFEGYLPRSEIDREINSTGTQTREPGLRITLGDPQGEVFDGRRWRSITTVLSTTGLDLNRSEFLEFYASQGDSLTLILDLGTVSEDAMFVDSAGLVSGTKPGTGTPWGQGLLDQEADPRLGEIWDDALDRLGVWGEDCQTQRGRVYPLGDPRANCTRSNGRADTEDLNGNGTLDVAERHVRYVVKLDGSSPYLARTRQETGTSFRLFRIPLRGPDGISVGGRFSDADWRAVRHLRITMTGARPDAVVLVRLGIVGSRWVKRGSEGVLRGIAGDTPGTAGQVEVASVSVLTEGGAYQSPPGVLDELNDPTAAFGGEAVEYNEKSLGIRYRDVQPEERGEVYYRFPQRPRNFLTYRQTRVWVVAREGDWGPNEPLYFFLKIGSDPENFYLFRSRLLPAPDPDRIRSGDWLPELLLDVERWLSLRQEAEELLLSSPPAPGAPPLEIWSPDSTYAVVLRDRARAPNLAQVRELSMGVWNRGQLPTSGEVWVNELRFSAPLRDPGFAGHVDVGLEAGEVLNARLSFARQGPLFRQLEGDPDYQRDRTLGVAATLQLGRLMPEAWGVDVPVSVVHDSRGQDPTFLSQSDLRADRLKGVRKVSSGRTRVSVAFRKNTPSDDPWVDAILRGLDARIGYTRTQSTTVTSEGEGRWVDASVSYRRQFASREIRAIPGFLEGVVRALLPKGLEDSVVAGKLRWSPERLSLGGSLVDAEHRTLRFDQIVAVPQDSLARATRSPRKGLDGSLSIAFRPFQPLTAAIDYLTVRDLLEPELASQEEGVPPLLEEERTRVAGLDLGWETGRAVRTRFGFQPELTDGLRATVNVSTSYLSDRNANLVRRTVVEGDTLRELQRNVGNFRDVLASVVLDPARVFHANPGQGGVEPQKDADVLRRLAGAVIPISVSWRRGLAARFNRAVVDPGAAFQLGWGGVDAFRFIDGDTASLLTERTSWVARSGVNLPLTAVLGVDFSETRSAALDLRSDRTFYSRSWPSVRLSMRDLPLPGSIRGIVQGVSVSSGYQATFQDQSFGLGRGQRRVRDEWQVPLEVTIRWPGSVSLAYRSSFQNASATDPTGDTEEQRRLHDLSLTSSFRPPGTLGQVLQRPLQVVLRFQHSDQGECRVNQGSEKCVPFVDQRNRSLNLTVGTLVSQFELGLQMSYTDRQSFVGRRAGSTQFQVGVFGQFLVAAGPLEMLGGR